MAAAENSGPEPRSRPRVGRPFAKGRSGNPGGRPKRVKELVELARAQTLPTLQQHLAMAQSVNTQVAGAPGSGIVAASPTTVVVVPGARAPWCGGAYAQTAGSNFGSCTP